MATKNYDYVGWATVYNKKCKDGRTILPGAFDHIEQGYRVPLVWSHKHNDPELCLGHAYLFPNEKGVYAGIILNDGKKAQAARTSLESGDYDSLSIWADGLKERRGLVSHGDIQEVSLCLTGANPYAKIVFDPTLAHAENGEVAYEGMTYYSNEEIVPFEDDSVNNPYLAHSSDEDEDDEDEDAENQNDERDEKETQADKYDRLISELTPEQAETLAELIGGLLPDEDDDDDDELEHSAYDDEDDEDSYDDADYEYDDDDSDIDDEADDDDEYNDEDAGSDDDDELEHDIYTGEEDNMWNVFDNNYNYGAQEGVTRFTDADFQTVLAHAQQKGSLKEAFKEEYPDKVLRSDGFLAHDGTAQAQLGFYTPEALFPDAHELNNPPAWIKRDTGWATEFWRETKHVPFSRLRMTYADITEEEARAKGYIKGNEKKAEVFKLLRRVTQPTTIYKHQSMHHDDIKDITSFDVIVWIKGEMRMMLNEEIALAGLLGDGRDPASEDKIDETCIRPIVSDASLYTIMHAVVPATGQKQEEALIDASILAQVDYRGSGSMTFYTTPQMRAKMLLIRDGFGHRLYKDESEVALAMSVSKIRVVEPMIGREIDGHDLLGIAVNPADYTYGADKGGEVEFFDDFDLKFNRNDYLIETRCSGSLTKPKSAIVFVADTVPAEADRSNGGITHYKPAATTPATPANPDDHD